MILSGSRPNPAGAMPRTPFEVKGGLGVSPKRGAGRQPRQGR